MRAIWKGSISFGLVNIPIALFPATRREELKFQLLRKKDHSPINYKRVAEVDGEEVPWDEIVKGFQYEKGRFVVLEEEDLERVPIEATQTVNITTFVDLAEVNPAFFYKPYFMEPEKGADKAYVLLRDALVKTGKIGIATVVLKTRQYLAAVKPQEPGLILELMHFAEELVDVGEFKVPQSTKAGEKELKMAETLIESMSGPWKPEEFRDEYKEAVKKIIDEKIENPEAKPSAPLPKRKATNVIDLVEVLQKSLTEAQNRTSSKREDAPASHRKTTSRAPKTARTGKTRAIRPSTKRKAAA